MLSELRLSELSELWIVLSELRLGALPCRHVGRGALPCRHRAIRVKARTRAKVMVKLRGGLVPASLWCKIGQIATFSYGLP